MQKTFHGLTTAEEYATGQRAISRHLWVVPLWVWMRLRGKWWEELVW
ncbi:MAG: hypothetical protein J6T03_02270 [Bacteroidales bacterium]|nr:hypothetical protein [Bacteroidales bacterium]